MAIVESKEGERLGITHKGIGVIEHYVMARRLMTRNIYHSQKKLAIEALLVQMLATLAETLEQDANYTFIQKTRLGQFLINANRFNVTAKTTEAIESHKRAFLKHNYENYKDLCDYDVFALIKQLSGLEDSAPATQIASRLQHRKMPKIVRLDSVDVNAVERELQEFKRTNHAYHDWQLMLIKTPHRAYSGEDDPILVVNEQGEINPIGKFSFMINAISDRFEHGVFLCLDNMIAEEKSIIKLLQHLQQTQTLVTQ
jgi:HD superfamily phosphohydrolase